MKIAVMSDLHLECDDAAMLRAGIASTATSDFYLHPIQPKADVLVLAGDIHGGSRGIDWAARQFQIPTVIIAGNHEPYGCELFHVIAENRHKAATIAASIVFLEKATWEGTTRSGERARFVGTTLWTDFDLYGDPELSMALARERLADFQVIQIERGYRLRTLFPRDIARLHIASVAFLREQLDRPFDGLTIVVTHYAPSPKSIASNYAGNPLNPAFVSDLEPLIRAYKPDLWIHGHVHDSFNYTIGRTQIICNPRGYFPSELNPSFDPLLIVEASR